MSRSALLAWNASCVLTMWRCPESLAAPPLRLSITSRIKTCSSKILASRSRVRSAGPWTSCRTWIKNWRRLRSSVIVRGLCDGEMNAAPSDAAAFAAELREALSESFQFLVRRVERGEFGSYAQSPRVRSVPRTAPILWGQSSGPQHRAYPGRGTLAPHLESWRTCPSIPSR